MRITVTYEIEVPTELVERCLFARDAYDAAGDPNDDGYDYTYDERTLMNDVEDLLVDQVRAQANPGNIYNASELNGVRYVDALGNPVW